MIKVESNTNKVSTLFVGKHYLIIKEINENKFNIMFQKGDKLEVLLDGSEGDRPFITITKGENRAR